MQSVFWSFPSGMSNVLEKIALMSTEQFTFNIGICNTVELLILATLNFGV